MYEGNLEKTSMIFSVLVIFLGIFLKKNYVAIFTVPITKLRFAWKIATAYFYLLF